jgi:predicted nucleic acid-binding protein
MSSVLVDSNVLLDVLTEDRRWFDWSSHALETCANMAVLVINPIVYAEVSVRFHAIEALDEALAGFLAGKCFHRYRNAGGTRRSPLPDFYIGAHAAVRGMTLLTRDATRYQTYFPTVRLISPSASP